MFLHLQAQTQEDKEQNLSIAFLIFKRRKGRRILDISFCPAAPRYVAISDLLLRIDTPRSFISEAGISTQISIQAGHHH